MTRTDEPKRFGFSFDSSALPFVISELVSQGATGLAIDSTSKLATVRPQLPIAIRNRTRVLDRRNRIRDRVNQVFRPIADEIGLNPADVDLITDPIVGPQRHVLDLPPERKSTWSDLLLTHSATFHLLLGISSRIQIDIPLREFKDAVHRLHPLVKEPTSRATIGFLEALIDSYTPYIVGSAAPMLSANDDAWVQVFEEFMEDAAYQEYAATRSALGYSARARAAVARTWTIARRMLKHKVSQRLLKFTAASVKASTGLPADPTDVFSDYFERTHYLPPIVKTTTQLARAQRLWLQANPLYTGTMVPQFEHFNWLASARVPHLVSASIEIDREWFTSLYTTEPPLDLTETKWQRAFERFFAINLEPPYICSQHDIEIGCDDVLVSWGKARVKMSMTCCCENAGKAAFASMAAFKPEKNQEYAAAMNEEIGQAEPEPF